MKNALLLWNHAGERPYEVLIEHGIYDAFLRELRGSSLQCVDPIFRGTRRHQELQIGDYLDYHYATSWSDDLKVALTFAESASRPVVLSLIGYGIRGVENPLNTYSEKELVLHPLRLQVIDRAEVDGYIILSVIESTKIIYSRTSDYISIH